MVCGMVGTGQGDPCVTSPRGPLSHIPMSFLRFGMVRTSYIDFLLVSDLLILTHGNRHIHIYIPPTVSHMDNFEPKDIVGYETKL